MTQPRIVSIAGVRFPVDDLSRVEAQLIAAYEAVAQGDAVLAPYEPLLLASLPPDSNAIITVLDIAEIARGMEHDGIKRYSWTRMRNFTPLTTARLVPLELGLGLRLLGSGAAGMGLMLVAAELRDVADRGFGAAALHWQISDLLVATGNVGWISDYVNLARSCGLRAGLCSNDAGRALQLVDELHGCDFVIAPLSAAGYRMKPDQWACETIIRRRKVDLIPHLGSVNSLDPEDCSYAQRLGLDRFVVDA